MYTTIKISKANQKRLDRMKTRPSETYDDLVSDMLEDHMDLNPQFAKELEESHAQATRGERIAWADVKRRLGLHGRD